MVMFNALDMRLSSEARLTTYIEKHKAYSLPLCFFGKMCLKWPEMSKMSEIFLEKLPRYNGILLVNC